MKKLYSVLAGILAFVLIVSLFKINMDYQIKESKEGVRNLRTYERFWSGEAQRLVIENNTLPVFGSSELVELSSYENNVGSFLNGEQMNIMTIGAGYFQSLYHAMALGAISKSVSSGKVALFLSPQWFSEEGCGADAFASRLSENLLLEFLANPDISKENKLYVLERAEKLLVNSPAQLERVNKYRKAIENPISIDSIYMGIMNVYWEYRAEYEVYTQLDMTSTDLPYYDLASLDFDKILKLAEEQGKDSCTNNDFGIYDEYWDTYVKETYENGEVLEKVQIYTQSPEYDDLRCFLSIANELNIEVIVVSIPVNQRWYNYTGSLCDEYYQIIRDIVAEYDNVIFCDMSVYEDEMYFLKDIMHLGWKGWARINEVLYTEFTK